MFNFIERLIDPVTVLSALGGIALFLLWRFHREWRRRLLLVVIPYLAVVLFCIPAVAYFAAGLLEWRYPPLETRPATAVAIVVLGGGVKPAGDFTHQPKPSESTVNRCIQAARLYRQSGHCPVVVSGGKSLAIQGSVPESEVMRDLLMMLGVEGEDIIVETGSTNTYENAVNSARLLKQKSITNIVLVTDATHLRRACLCFEAQGITPIPSGCNYQADSFRLSLFQFLPRISAARTNRMVLHEIMAMFVYWLRGWI